jgi:hypothetical protein
MQQALDLWEGGIRPAAQLSRKVIGTLSISNGKGNWRYVTEWSAGTTQGPRCNGNVAALERLSASDAHAPESNWHDGNDQAQFRALRRSQNLEGTDTGRASSPKLAWGRDYNDLTYSTLPAPATATVQPS